MTSLQKWGESADLLRRWVLRGGRDVMATTRESFMSIEGRTGASIFVALWVFGRMGAGPWNVWGESLGGEVLPTVRAWYAGEMVLFQAVLLGAHAFVGVLWGTLIKNAWGWMGSLWPTAAADRFKGWVVALISGLAIFLLHLGLLMRDLARHPALYQETFLDRGGLWAWGQRFSLRAMPDMGGEITIVFVAAVAGMAVLRMGQRGIRWFLGFSRPTRVAVGVLGSALLLFIGGIRFVIWTRAVRNEGPNLVLVSVDGLRAESIGGEKNGEPPSIARLKRGSLLWGRTVPPMVDLTPTLATALTGRSPLSHGIRHDFPAGQDLAVDFNSLPALARANGWWTEFLTDGSDGFLERMGGEFDRARVPPRGLPSRLARRQGERSPHLLPYLSGRVGRFIPLLRGSPFLADPSLLADDTMGALNALERKSKFFLWVHFSSLKPSLATSSPRGAARLARGSPDFFRRPGDGRSERPLTDDEWIRVRRIYNENVVDFQKALDVLLQTLTLPRWRGNTVFVLWSSRATLLSDREESDARALAGPAFFDTPFWVVPSPSRGGGRRWGGLGRSVDVAPTVARLMGLSPPSGWEGVDLTEGIPEEEARLIYLEASGPDLSSPYRRTPPLVQLLEEDPDSPGCLRLDPAWEDPVLLFRDRAIQLGEERLSYRPGLTGVTFEYSRGGRAVSRWEKDRIKVLRDMFYRCLSKESGWRPQNNYWIPDAFLREASGEEKHGD